MSLYDALMEIYAQFGYYKEALKSITLKGIDGVEKKFVLDDKSWIAVRPSGTEPKIKFYFGVCGDSNEASDNKIEALIRDIEDKIDSI